MCSSSLPRNQACLSSSSWKTTCHLCWASKVDLVMKDTLKPLIGRHILSEVVGL